MNTTNLSAKLIMPKGEDAIIRCEGHWNVSAVTHIDHHFNQITWPESGNLIIDGSNIKIMDSIGAWLLQKCIHALNAHGPQRINF